LLLLLEPGPAGDQWTAAIAKLLLLLPPSRQCAR